MPVVSIQLPNRYEAVVAAVAALSVGAVINPLLPNYRERELSHVFATAAPAAVFTPGRYRGCDHPALVAEVSHATGHTPLHVVVDGSADPAHPTDRGDSAGRATTYDELVASGDGSAPLGDRPAAAVSELIFTSGTEAAPKAIMHTEQTAGFSVRVAHHDLGVTHDDVVWMPSPVGHSTGFNYGLRFALHHGLPLILQDRWDAAAALALVQEHRCSYTLAATTFLQDLTEAAAAAARPARLAPPVRQRRCAGAPGVGRRSGGAGDPSASPLRLDRGAGGHVEPSLVVLGPEARHRRRRHEPRGAAGGRRRRPRAGGRPAR